MNKYYYLYKITNNITNEYYYGVHETSKLNDGYFGSGSVLKKNIEKYGLENFEKAILEFFPNRHELMKEEKRIVNNELLKDPKCLNVILGGGELKGSVGKKCVIDNNGIYRMIDKDDNNYQNFFIGRVCINKDGRMKYIKPYELEYYISLGWKKGTIYDSPGKNKIWIHNGESRMFICKSDVQEYIKQGWQLGMYDPGSKIWVNKNDNSKQIHKEDLQKYLNEGWNLGSGKKTINGKIQIKKESKRKYVNKEDLQKYLDDGWNRLSWNNTIWINKDTQNKRVNKENLQKYLDEGWLKGKYNENNTKRRRVLLYDLNGNLIKEFNKVSDANKEGYNNIHKFANKNKVYMKQYILKYGD